MLTKICILDYGSGNVGSVKNAFERLGIESVVSNEVNDVKNASHLVLPGVGAFKSSMEKIEATLPVSVVLQQLNLGKPFLGICVGMQVLSEQGFEFETHKGLGLFAGSEVVELPDAVSKPHVGWNSLQVLNNHPILNNIEDGSDFYFVHSYVVSKLDHSNVVAVCDYGIKFPAVTFLDNVIGVQFHPEKSQSNGEKLLLNFARSLS